MSHQKDERNKEIYRLVKIHGCSLSFVAQLHKLSRFRVWVICKTYSQKEKQGQKASIL